MIKIYQDFLLNNGLKFMINLKKNCNVNKETRIKTPMLRSDLRDFSDAYIVVKGVIPLLIRMKQKEIKRWNLKLMHHLSTAFQKLMVYKLKTQKT